jgi:hypothetical protein
MPRTNYFSGLVLAFALIACLGKQKAAPTATGGDTAAATQPTCDGHMANGQCHADFAAACAALSCAAPMECISLETMPPQAQCRTPPK